MTPSTRHPFRPDYAIPPGATLRDRIEEIGLSQAELAARSGLSTKHVNQVIQGVAPLSHETALILERVTGMPAALWNALEANYREAILRGQELSEEDKSWLNQLPIKALQDRGLLPRNVSPGQLFDSALSFFGVADRAAWERVWIRPAAVFRRSGAFQSDRGDVAAWLRLGQLAAREVDTLPPFNAAAFRQVLNEIRDLTRELDSDRLVGICASVGVVVVFVKEIDKCRVSGATWWATPTRAVIALSDRYKADDFFWFTFFHEAAHLLLHSKKETFIDDGTDQDALEEEANRFAGDTLIPPKHASRLRTLNTAEEVMRFADQVGIAPGIVVGRLHHDELWGWSKGNDLRRHLRIVD